jgi:hypothetical protein
MIIWKKWDNRDANFDEWCHFKYDNANAFKKVGKSVEWKNSDFIDEKFANFSKWHLQNIM